MGGLDVAWQKSFHEDNIVDRTDGAKVLAMSAFLLSSLPSPIERKALVKEMWDSGAEVMVREVVNSSAVHELTSYCHLDSD